MTTVQWVIICVFVLILGLTVVAAKNKQTTVSNTLQNWATKYNWMAFMSGGLVGHWFMPNMPGLRAWYWLLIPMALLAVWDVVMIYKQPLPKKHWSRYPLLWVALGIPYGGFMWGSIW